MSDLPICLFKKPTAAAIKKRVRPRVLKEETYIEGLGKIIQRDFFPDLDKLKVQNQYLDAEKRQDVEELRRLHLRFMSTRNTPAAQSSSSLIPNLEIPSATDGITNNLTLDQYLCKYTSEDNESFNEIVEESHKKHLERYAYLAIEEAKACDQFNTRLRLPSIEEQCAISNRPYNVETWPYKIENSLMFTPDGAEMTDEEISALRQKQLTVVYQNTTLNEKPFDDKSNKETIHEIARNNMKNVTGKIGVDGNEINESGTPKVAGFSFVRTPSPNPGVDSTPLMTWGEIEGSPFRLDASDTPLRRLNTPSFCIKDVPKREQIALDLGEKYRNQKKRAIDVARKRRASVTPSPKRMNRLNMLNSVSPALKHFASLSRPNTPRDNTTGKISAMPSPRTNLTDNLLQIKSACVKRKSAADFF